MSRKKNIIRYIVIAICTLITLFFLLVAALILLLKYSPITPPPRPDSVPVEAEWHGGPDGGAWIVVEQTDSSNMFYARIFFDHGVIWDEGYYELPNDVHFNDLDDCIVGFDGTNINLKYQNGVRKSARRQKRATNNY